MLNPNKKIAKSRGIDLPILYVYLAGRISGEHIEKCLGWRNEIIKYYQNYKGKGAYPIAFLSPLNSGEADSVDKKGLTSNIPPNLIYDKDILSVERADVIVANMDDFFEEGLGCPMGAESLEYYKKYSFELYKKVMNRRENMGTHWELAIAHYLKKPIILIAPERRQEIFKLHPFTKRASVIVTSVEQLFKEKWLQTLYKSIAGAIY